MRVRPCHPLFSQNCWPVTIKWTVLDEGGRVVSSANGFFVFRHIFFLIRWTIEQRATTSSLTSTEFTCVCLVQNLLFIDYKSIG